MSGLWHKEPSPPVWIKGLARGRLPGNIHYTLPGATGRGLGEAGEREIERWRESERGRERGRYIPGVCLPLSQGCREYTNQQPHLSEVKVLLNADDLVLPEHFCHNWVGPDSPFGKKTRL